MPIGPGLVGAAVLIVGLFTLGRIVGWWLGRSEEITPRQRSVYQKLSLFVPLLVMWGTPVLFRVYPVGQRILPSGAAWAGALLNSVIAAIVALLGLTGALWGLRPFRTARPMVQGELWRRRRLARVFVVCLTLFTAVAIEFSFLFTDPMPTLVFATLVSGAAWSISNTVSHPVRSPTMQFGVRRPSETEREQIEQVYERLDIPVPDGIEITVDDGQESMAVLESGDQRVLALSDSLLSGFDTDTLSIGTAYAEGRAKYNVDLFQKLYTWVLWVAIVLLFWAVFMNYVSSVVTRPTVGGTSLMGLAIVLASRQLANWGQERIRMADEYAIEHIDVGSSVVTDLYRGPRKRLGVVSMETEFNQLSEKVRFEPDIKTRLEHIGLAGGDEPSNSGQ